MNVEIDENEEVVFDETPEVAEPAQAETVSQTEEEGGKQFTDEEKEEYGKKVERRINKEVAKRKALEAELQQERQQNEAFRRRFEEFENSYRERSQEQQTQTINSRMQQLRTQRANLLEEGDYEALNQIDDELMDLKIQARQAQQPRQEPVQQPVQQQYQEPQGAQDLPEAQQEWLAKNDWFFNPGKAQQAQRANNLYLSMLDEGYDPHDSTTYAELDKRLNPPKPTQPPPTAAPDRGGATGNPNRSNALTETEKANLRAWGFDPNDEKVRKQFIAEKKAKAGRA